MLFLVILIVPQSFAADFDNSTELTSDIPIDDEIEDINVDEEISQNSDNILSINQEDNVLSDSEAIYVSTDGDDYNNGDETSPYKKKSRRQELPGMRMRVAYNIYQYEKAGLQTLPR